MTSIKLRTAAVLFLFSLKNPGYKILLMAMNYDKKNIVRLKFFESIKLWHNNLSREN